MQSNNVKTFVRIYYPGSFFAETEVREVNHRDPRKMEVPSAAFAFQFEDARVGPDPDGVEITGKPFNESGRFYPDGEVIHVDDLIGDEYLTLRANLSSLGGYGVRTRRGNWHPFRVGVDAVI